MIKVSILVPVYNVERYLPQCLESLIHQTLKEIEIICINDGSTDASPGIVEEYRRKDSRIRLINKENTGYGHSMNIGLQSASGEYIGIVESDDYASPEMFDDLYRKAGENSAEVVKSNFFEHENDQEDRERFVELLKGFSYDRLLTVQEIEKLYMVSAQIWSAIYRRDFLIQHGIHFHETPGASYQDTSFAFQVWFFAKRVLLVREAYLHYRIDNPGSSINSGAKLYCFCDEYAYIEDFLQKNIHDIRIEYIKTVIKFRDYLWNYSRVAGKYQYTFLLRIKAELESAEKDGNLEKEYFKKFPNVWEELMQIKENSEAFYDNTAKYYRDERIDKNSMNGVLYFKGVFDKIRDSQCVIVYGAGKISKALLDALQNRGINNVRFIMVSQTKGNPKELQGIAVNCVEDLEDYNKTALVVIAVSYHLQLDIMTHLRSKGFLNMISIDRELIKYF